MTARSPRAATAYETATIAKYEFKTGTGNIAYDTSGRRAGAEPHALGRRRLGRRLGHQRQGRRQGAGHRDRVSKKLADLIKSTGEFTIEAWVAQRQRRAGRRVHRQLLGGRHGAQRHARAARVPVRGATRAATRPARTATRSLLTRRGRPGRAGRAAARGAHVRSRSNGRRIYVNGDVHRRRRRAGRRLARRLGRQLRAGARQRDLDQPPVARRDAPGGDPQPRADARRRSSRTSTAGVGETYFMLFNVSHLVDVPQAT